MFCFVLFLFFVLFCFCFLVFFFVFFVNLMTSCKKCLIRPYHVVVFTLIIKNGTQVPESSQKVAKISLNFPGKFP